MWSLEVHYRDYLSLPNMCDSISGVMNMFGLGRGKSPEALGMKLDWQKITWGDLGKQEGNAPLLHEEEGHKQRKVTTSSFVDFYTWGPSLPGQRGRKCTGLPSLVPHLPSQTSPNQPITSIRASYSSHPKFEKATKSSSMKMSLRSQTTLQKPEIWALWGFQTTCIFKGSSDRFTLDHWSTHCPLSHPSTIQAHPTYLLRSMRSGGLGWYGPRLIAISLLHLSDTY